MQSDPDLLALAHSVLSRSRTKTWDIAWDSRGTPPEGMSQGCVGTGTAKSTQTQGEGAAIPLSHTLGTGTVGHRENAGTPIGTVAGQHYSGTLSAPRSRCPDLTKAGRWQQAIHDAESLLSAWGQQAYALGWTARELFGLHPMPERPMVNYQRLSRYDHTGLVWLLQGNPVVTLTADTAAIKTVRGGILTYRKHNKPALGPFGDTLDDFDGGFRYLAGIGHYDDGRLAEIFLNAEKGGTAIDDAARDSAVVASIALQHGVAPDTLRRALMRNSTGTASGPLGVLLDLLAAENRSGMV